MKRRFKFFSVLAVLFIFTLLFSGCGGGESSQANPTGTVPAIIPDTTKALDQTTTQSVLSVTLDTVTFNQMTTQLNSLSSGDVIVMGVTNQTPEGLLRKVTAVSQSGNEVIVNTAPATVEDAIEQAEINISKDLTSSDISSAVPLVTGVRLMAAQQAPNELYLELNDVVLLDKDKNPATTNDQIRVNGSITLSPSFNLYMLVEKSTLKKLIFTNTTKETVDISLTSDVTEPSITVKKEIHVFTFGTITILVGGVPVTVTPVLTINIGADGQVSTGLTAGVTQTATLTVGVTYDYGKWTPQSSFSNDFQFNPPSPLSVALTAKAYAGPELTVKLWGSVSPNIGINGYLEADLDPFSDPSIELYGGLDVDLGVKVEILGLSLTDYEKPGVIGYRRLLYSNGSPVPGYSNATFTGPWMAIMSQFNKYLVFDGAGGVTDNGSHNQGTPPGTYQVQTDGSFSIVLNFKSDPQVNMSGTLTSATAGTFTGTQGADSFSGNLVKVSNRTACSGNWSGTLTETAGGTATHNISFTIDSTGALTSLTGFDQPVSGKMYCESGKVAAVLRTAGPYPYNIIGLTGTVSGDNIIASYEPDSGTIKGTATLTRGIPVPRIPDITGGWVASLNGGTSTGTTYVETETNIGATNGTGAITGSGSLTIPGVGTFPSTIDSANSSVGVYDGMNNNVIIVTTTDMSLIPGCGTVTSTSVGIGNAASMSGTYTAVDSAGESTPCTSSGTVVATR